MRPSGGTIALSVQLVVPSGATTSSGGCPRDTCSTTPVTGSSTATAIVATSPGSVQRATSPSSVTASTAEPVLDERGPQRRPELAHRRRGLEPVARHVAHDEREAPGRQHERVVPVAAHETRASRL